MYQVLTLTDQRLAIVEMGANGLRDIEVISNVKFVRKNRDRLRTPTEWNYATVRYVLQKLQN